MTSKAWKSVLHSIFWVTTITSTIILTYRDATYLNPVPVRGWLQGGAAIIFFLLSMVIAAGVVILTDAFKQRKFPSFYSLDFIVRVKIIKSFLKHVGVTFGLIAAVIAIAALVAYINP